MGGVEEWNGRRGRGKGRGFSSQNGISQIIRVFFVPGYLYYWLSSGVRALALALVPSTITDYLALALAQAKSKLSEYL